MKNETKFYVIAALIQDGPGGKCMVKYWKATHTDGKWVDDIAKAKHYATLATVKNVFKNAYNGYLGNWGMDLLRKQYPYVEFKVMETVATVEMTPIDDIVVKR